VSLVLPPTKQRTEALTDIDASGRPASSHYFVGTQADDLFYLDPHHTRLALPFHQDASQYTEEEVASCHTQRLRKIDIREMDPSMLIGFLIRDEADWKDWRTRISAVPGKAVIRVGDKQPAATGSSQERQSAIDEVETFDTEDDDM
jgi:cysteine protease ATG4